MSSFDVVVPCYKYARYLEECVLSVLSQPVDVRVLIIDDASPDDTPEIAESLVRRDSRVTYRRNASNRGHISTFNEGLDWCAGDYNLLLSADDLLTPGALARAAFAMDRHPNAALCYGGILRISCATPYPAPSTSAAECAYAVLPGAEWLASLCRDPSESITSPEAIVRTRVQKEVGRYSKDLPHTGDQEMWMRIASRGDVVRLCADQAYYRIHSRAMHLERFGEAVTDIRHRKAAFDRFFSVGGLPDAEARRLASLAGEGLARMALWDAYRAFHQGDAALCRTLEELAAEIWPASRTWALSARVRLMRTVGPRRWSRLTRIAGMRRHTPGEAPA